MNQNVNYTNPRAGKLSMTIGKLAKGAGYITGLAAITGLVLNNQDLSAVQPDYLQGFLEDVVSGHTGLFTASVISNISGGILSGLGRWKNWRKNE